MQKRNFVTAVSALTLVGVCGTAAMAQNGNDLCASATAIAFASGQTAFTVTGGTTAAATATANLVNLSGAPACGSTTASRDVWYVLTAPTGGTLRVETCSAASYDTVLSVHNLCPGSVGATALGCDDDACTSNRSRVNTSVVAGQTVYIRVGGFSSGSGTFTLSVSMVVPTPHPAPDYTAPLGPDVIVGTIVDVGRYGTGVSNGIPVTAFAVGTDSCNPGDRPVTWIDNTNHPGYGSQEHPVIAQNMFRYNVVSGAGRFVQIGQSWLKHGFLSTNSNACGTCQQPPFGGDQLGVNCSDTYGASLNGGQTYLGPRSAVNATTGAFPFPHTTGSSAGVTGYATIGMRLQVPTADVTSQPAGTRYIVDTHYVTQDDAQYVRPSQTSAINALNNLSWRELNAANIGNAAPTFTGGTRQREPGIFAWRQIDPAVTLNTADHQEPNDAVYPFTPPFWTGKTITARYWVGARVTTLSPGNYHYEYNVYNVNSDRSAGSFSIPFPSGGTTTNVQFAAPLSHSGEPYSNASWTMTRAGDVMKFSTDSFATNANANAIRWGTMYTFRFDSTVQPVSGTATIGLFKPGTDATASAINMPVPEVVTCLADFNADGDLNPDDLADYIGAYFADLAGAGADFNGDGEVNPDDLADFIGAYFAGC